MISIGFMLIVMMIIFAIMGTMRGWAKEMLVTFSAILALFIITVLERFIPYVRDVFARQGTPGQFWMNLAIILLLTFFGYQTPTLPKVDQARFKRERLADALLGFMLGAINGYLVFGTILFYLHTSGYPFPDYIVKAPTEADPLGKAALALIPWLPPAWLNGVPVYFAVALAFVFVLVVFL